MKGTRLLSIFALSLLSLTAPAMAQTESYASGLYRFLLEDDQVKSLEFESRTVNGATSGFMTFVDDSRIPDTDDGDVPGDGMPFYIKADLNSMTVEKNRAVMDGIIRESSHKTYLGKFVQLVVEDNGQELRVPDRLAWSLCRTPGRGWVPSDAERKDDDGAYLSWWATDAERRDDVGIPSENLLPYEPRCCPAYPLWLYDFAGVTKWDGDIVVRP